ncbi:glycosyltransferase [Ekhidna sp.]|uniref:glycosyltransferase n=1 Tax=Ekhidna sp. TaxID=2608089 RepID=UPI0032982E6A
MGKDINKYIIPYRKIKVDDTLYWDVHRGGWRDVVKTLKEQFHTDDGVLFLNAIEDKMFHGGVFTEPWIGFVHQVPRTNLEIFPDLERLLKRKNWLDSLPYCRGVFTLSSYLKDYLDSKNLPIEVNRIFYPVDFKFKEFDFDLFLEEPKKVVFVGEYLRKFESFFWLKAKGFKKILLENEAFKKTGISTNPSVEVIPRVSDQVYDELLSSSLVFLDLYDAPANTTVIECMARNTPIVVNKLPGIVEYLGKDYPLYYETMSEADKKLSNLELIRSAYDYLASLNKENITTESFVKQINGSPIYRNLDIPNSQKDKIFKQFDISIVITSYNRVYNIHALLDRFCNQKFSGTFEIILWNNNIAFTEEIDEIYQEYNNRLNIRLIHSSENYYCAMRLTMAHLMQSDHLLICDDDVLPNEDYIQKFWDNYNTYGPDVVLCARGHKFDNHKLDRDYPDRVWKDGKNIKFYDEAEEDIQVHFFHADNCLIPRKILLRLQQFEWDNLDFILVDDYWISYLVSHELNIPIWKIKMNDQFSFTECADDENIALFHNPKVQQARVNFYIYHMEKGWPASVIEKRHYQRGKEEIPSLSVEKSVHFDTFDLSVVICTYSRSFNLKEIIRRFSEQETSKTFELIIWNNNYEFRWELLELYEQYSDRVNLRIFHSSENILCKPRLALSSLVMGEKIIFCDDDVMPKQNYLSELSYNHEKKGQGAIICVSGESFISNQLDEDNPYLIWKRDNIKLHKYDEYDCGVHYFHANSCILSKDLLKKASEYSYPKPETAWIDDYWLSYLFSHVLDIDLRKIDGKTFMSFTNDSDSNDAEVAMSRNPNIKYHKVAFYLYHYRKNWRPCLSEIAL